MYEKHYADLANLSDEQYNTIIGELVIEWMTKVSNIESTLAVRATPAPAAPASGGGGGGGGAGARRSSADSTTAATAASDTASAGGALNDDANDDAAAAPIGRR